MKKRKFGDGGSTGNKYEGMSVEEEARQRKLDAQQERAYNAADKTPPAPASAASAPKKLAKGGRVKRYEDGGEIDPMEAANASAESQDIAASVPAGPTVRSEPAPEPSFKEAFAEARAEGLKSFVWHGKKFTTDLAKPSKAPNADMPKMRSPTEPTVSRIGIINRMREYDKSIKGVRGMASGGSVKGWGQARGARAAKIV